MKSEGRNSLENILTDVVERYSDGGLSGPKLKRYFLDDYWKNS